MYVRICFFCCGLLIGACSSDSATPPVSTVPDVITQDTWVSDVREQETTKIDSQTDTPPIACAFNRECPSSMRCECDEIKGCFCASGARGTGKNGVDTCVTGNDCESSVCVEGPDSKFYCSGECGGDAGSCGGVLPLCTNISFIGQICTRTPPKDAGTNG